MKVNCLSKNLSEEEKIAIGIKSTENPVFQLTVGATYLVLGLTCQINYYCGPMLQVKDDFGKCVFVPLCLFEISDPRLSTYWVAKRVGGFELALWPAEFYVDYFHDDLSNSCPAVVNLFNDLVKKMEDEFCC